MKDQRLDREEGKEVENRGEDAPGCHYLEPRDIFQLEGQEGADCGDCQISASSKRDNDANGGIASGWDTSTPTSTATGERTASLSEEHRACLGVSSDGSVSRALPCPAEIRSMPSPVERVGWTQVA